MQNLPKGVSPEWISTAREYVDWSNEQQWSRNEAWGEILESLEDEMTSVDFLISEIEQQK
jgi:hypothetical protein